MTEAATELHIEELFKEQEAQACEADECVSDRREPPSYFISHTGAAPSCTRLFCEPCATQLKATLEQVKMMAGLIEQIGGESVITFKCLTCDTEMAITEAIIRPM